MAEIVLQAHKRLDASGYPQGLTGTDILMKAKIPAVADAVEAIALHRPYRAALGLESAMVVPHGSLAHALIMKSS